MTLNAELTGAALRNVRWRHTKSEYRFTTLHVDGAPLIETSSVYRVNGTPSPAAS